MTLLWHMEWLLLPVTLCYGNTSQAPGSNFIMFESSSDQCLYQRLNPIGDL